HTRFSRTGVQTCALPISIINVARTLLLHGDWQASQARERALLAGVYARTFGGATVEVAQARLEELFRELKNVYDNLTTSKSYSRSEERRVGKEGRWWVLW